jgi:hypothetical protein
MGPLHSKIKTAPVWSSYSFLDTLTPKITTEKRIKNILLILFYIQNCYFMETGSGSMLTPEEAARMGDEATATTAAAATPAAAAASTLQPPPPLPASE